MKIKFANGNTYEAANVDEAIAKCLADGNDPFNPVVLTEEQDKIEPTDEHRE